MMNRIFIIFFLLTIPVANAQIIPTYTINSTTIQKIDTLFDKDTIVFIELDEVLVMPKSKMFYYNDNPNRLFIQNLINLSNQDDRYLNTLIKWYQTRQLRLVEDGWLDFINDLEKRDVAVYGLCSMPIHLPNVEQTRFLELQKLGVKFTDKIQDKDVLELARQNAWSSVFYHGIVYTGPFSKSQTLLDLIKITNISPKKIVVFGKIRSELEMLEYSPLKTFRIDIYSILYMGARQFIDKPNPQVVQLQQRTLLEKGKWLEDDEAEEMLKQDAK